MEIIRTSTAKAKTNTQLGTTYSPNQGTACGFIWHFMLIEMELQKDSFRKQRSVNQCNEKSTYLKDVDIRCSSTTKQLCSHGRPFHCSLSVPTYTTYGNTCTQLRGVERSYSRNYLKKILSKILKAKGRYTSLLLLDIILLPSVGVHNNELIVDFN